MVMVAFTVRMDEELKNNFEKMCESFGISMTAAINLFATAVVNEKRIPFEIRSKSCTKEEAKELFESARAHILSKYPNGMTLDEINEIIDEVRREREEGIIKKIETGLLQARNDNVMTIKETAEYIRKELNL